MVERFEERFDKISQDLKKLSEKAVAVCGDAKAAGELGQEVVQEKMEDAKGDLVAVRERIRVAEEESKSHLASEVIKAQMLLEAKVEDIKTARDKKKLEKYIDSHIIHLNDLYETINYLLTDVELTTLETAAAAAEYKEKFDGEEEEEA